MGVDAVNGTENMTFRDNTPGLMDSRGSVMDHTRDLGFTTDTQLSDFFKRPIKIFETDWSVSTPLFERINPWTLFWDNPRNIEKIKNFYLLKCTMHIKILINGNAFYYGRAIASYEPLGPIDGASPVRPWTQEDFVRGSQRMHVYINPTTSEGGSLDLPFFFPDNAFTVPGRSWQYAGNLVLASINNLLHANGGTEPLTISVMAWADNVTYAIPTGAVPNVPEMADEHNMNVISRPASTIANYAGSLTNIPTIGPFMRATQIGASAVASVAKIFGYSAPNELNYEVYTPNARHSLSVVDTKQNTNKLTIDSKQEITLDPRTTGIQPTDELPIASIAGRESYLTSFDWDISSAPESFLFNARVDPGLHARNGDEYHFPACAFAALPFKYWRGTMRFRFQIVASEYHKGRIRIVYDPYRSSSVAEYNTHYTTIHDISNEKDFTIDVGWAQDRPYVKSIGWDSTAQYGTLPLINDLRGNGTLSVYVLNQLSVPSAVVSNIQVNVFVSMLDDFEVAAPDGKFTNARFTQPLPPPGRATFLNVPEMDSGGASDMDNVDNAIEDPPTLDTMADAIIQDTDSNKLFFGEVIGSFRQLMKRSYRSETRVLPHRSNMSQFKLSRGAFPMYGGTVVGVLDPNSAAIQFSDGRKYSPAETTLLNYMSRAFLGWRGSVRWMFDTSHLGGVGAGELSNSLTVALNRTDTFNLTQTVVDTSTVPSTSVALSLSQQDRGGSAKGLFLGNTNVNPLIAVEVPYYSTRRFTETFLADNFTGFSRELPGFDFTIMLPGSDNLTDLSIYRSYCSAGEDFNFFFFNGMPPVYYEAEYPTDSSA